MGGVDVIGRSVLSPVVKSVATDEKLGHGRHGQMSRVWVAANDRHPLFVIQSDEGCGARISVGHCALGVELVQMGVDEFLVFVQLLLETHFVLWVCSWFFGFLGVLCTGRTGWSSLVSENVWKVIFPNLVKQAFRTSPPV